MIIWDFGHWYDIECQDCFGCLSSVNPDFHKRIFFVKQGLAQLAQTGKKQGRKKSGSQTSECVDYEGGPDGFPAEYFSDFYFTHL